MPFTRHLCSHWVSPRLIHDDDKFKILGVFALKKYDTNIHMILTQIENIQRNILFKYKWNAKATLSVSLFYQNLIIQSTLDYLWAAFYYFN